MRLMILVFFLCVLPQLSVAGPRFSIEGSNIINNVLHQQTEALRAVSILLKDVDSKKELKERVKLLNSKKFEKMLFRHFDKLPDDFKDLGIKVEFKESSLIVKVGKLKPVTLKAAGPSFNTYLINDKRVTWKVESGLESLWIKVFGRASVQFHTPNLFDLLIDRANANPGAAVWVLRAFIAVSVGGGVMIAGPCLNNSLRSLNRNFARLHGGSPSNPGPKRVRPPANPTMARWGRQIDTWLDQNVRTHFGGCAAAAIEDGDGVYDLEGALYHYCRNMAQAVVNEYERTSSAEDTMLRRVRNPYTDAGEVNHSLLAQITDDVLLDNVTAPQSIAGVDVYRDTGELNGGEPVLTFDRTITQLNELPESLQGIFTSIHRNRRDRSTCVAMGLTALRAEESGRPAEPTGQSANEI